MESDSVKVEGGVSRSNKYLVAKQAIASGILVTNLPITGDFVYEPDPEDRVARAFIKPGWTGNQPFYAARPFARNMSYPPDYNVAPEVYRVMFEEYHYTNFEDYMRKDHGFLGWYARAPPPGKPASAVHGGYPYRIFYGKPYVVSDFDSLLRRGARGDIPEKDFNMKTFLETPAFLPVYAHRNIQPGDEITIDFYQPPASIKIVDALMKIGAKGERARRGPLSTKPVNVMARMRYRPADEEPSSSSSDDHSSDEEEGVKKVRMGKESAYDRHLARKRGDAPPRPKEAPAYDKEATRLARKALKSDRRKEHPTAMKVYKDDDDFESSVRLPELQERRQAMRAYEIKMKEENELLDAASPPTTEGEEEEELMPISQSAVLSQNFSQSSMFSEEESPFEMDDLTQEQKDKTLEFEAYYGYITSNALPPAYLERFKIAFLDVWKHEVVQNLELTKDEIWLFQLVQSFVTVRPSKETLSLFANKFAWTGSETGIQWHPYEYAADRIKDENEKRLANNAIFRYKNIVRLGGKLTDANLAELRALVPGPVPGGMVARGV